MKPEPPNGLLILIGFGVWLAPFDVVLALELGRNALRGPFGAALLGFLLVRAVTLALDVWLIVLMATHRRRFRSAYALVAIIGWIFAWIDRALATTLPLDPTLIASTEELLAAAVLNGLVCWYVLRSKAAAASFPL